MPEAALRRPCSALAGILAILPLVSPLAAAEPEETTHQLAYKFKPNQFAHYLVTHKTTVRTQFGEAMETVYNESTTHKHYRVSAVDAKGVAILVPVIDRVQMIVRFGENDPVEWDSQSAEPPPRQLRNVAETIGKPLTRIKVKPNGELVSVVLMQAAIQQAKAMQKRPGAVPDNDPSRNFLVVFPEKKIGVGESWKDPFSVMVNVTNTLRQPVKLLRTYRLESLQGDLATIRVKTSVLSAVTNPRIRAQLIQRTPSGTIVFDRKRGLIVSRKLNIDKTVFGPFGEKSLMRAESEQTETLLNKEKGKSEKEKVP